MKVYTIIGGVNGTGKSSLTGVLRAQRNDLGVIVDVDRITALAGVSPLEGGKMAIRRIDDCLREIPPKNRCILPSVEAFLHSDSNMVCHHPYNRALLAAHRHKSFRNRDL